MTTSDRSRGRKGEPRRFKYCAFCHYNFAKWQGRETVLKGVETVRPLNPDLLCSIIDRLEASVNYNVINDIQIYTLYAASTSILIGG
jgi:hypothetical protein